MLDSADVDGCSTSSFVSRVSSVDISVEAVDLQQNNRPENAHCKHCDAALSGRVIANGFGGSSVMNARHSPKLIFTKNNFLNNKDAPKRLQIPVNGILGSAPESYMSSPGHSPKLIFTKNIFLNNKDAPKRLQIPVNGVLGSAPESYMSSPSRSPMRVCVSEQSQNNAFWETKPYPETSLFGSGHCSSPVSAQHLPSSSAVPRSPGRADNPPIPGSRWKKGKLLGRGTFGHVYAGLNKYESIILLFILFSKLIIP
ncbi:hypothetical protein KI387_002250, partial [Taxus chinensis]